MSITLQKIKSLFEQITNFVSLNDVEYKEDYRTIPNSYYIPQRPTQWTGITTTSVPEKPFYYASAYSKRWKRKIY